MSPDCPSLATGAGRASTLIANSLIGWGADALHDAAFQKTSVFTPAAQAPVCLLDRLRPVAA